PRLPAGLAATEPLDRRSRDPRLAKVDPSRNKRRDDHLARRRPGARFQRRGSDQLRGWRGDTKHNGDTHSADRSDVARVAAAGLEPVAGLLAGIVRANLGSGCSFPETFGPNRSEEHT